MQNLMFQHLNVLLIDKWVEVQSTVCPKVQINSHITFVARRRLCDPSTFIHRIIKSLHTVMCFLVVNPFCPCLWQQILLVPFHMSITFCLFSKLPSCLFLSCFSFVHSSFSAWFLTTITIKAIYLGVTSPLVTVYLQDLLGLTPEKRASILSGEEHSIHRYVLMYAWCYWSISALILFHGVTAMMLRFPFHF